MASKYWTNRQPQKVGKFTLTEEHKKSNGEIRIRIKDDKSGTMMLLSVEDLLDLEDLVADKAEEMEGRGLLDP